MATIGGISCTFVNGSIPIAKQRNETWYRPGISGYGARTLGYGDTEFELTAILYDTAANVLTWEYALQALQGTIVTVTNDRGQTNTRCFLESVSTATPTGAYVPGTTTRVRGEIKIKAKVV